MRFPTWIEQERSAAERARLKLKHALNLAALHRFGNTSMHELARRIDCSHASIFNALARGSFSATMAKNIESFFGRDQIRSEFLIQPLANERTNMK